MAVPSDRKRRPFILSLSLFLLLSALLVLAFLFLDPSPQSLPLPPSRLAAPTLSPPSQQQSPTPGNPPHSQPNAPAAKAEVSTDASQPDATTAAAKADEDTDASRPNATTGVENSGNSDSPRPDNNSDAAGGDGGEDEAAVAEVRWETCRVGRGVSAADYIPCLDNVKAIKALRSRRHMEHRERHCPVAPRPRCLVPMPAGCRPLVPWPRSLDMVRTLRACLRRFDTTMLLNQNWWSIGWTRTRLQGLAIILFSPEVELNSKLVLRDTFGLLNR